MSAPGNPTHLDPSAAAFLALPDDARITQIEAGCWIGYPAAKRALNCLDDLMRHPRTRRMPNFLIVADSNNGKTEVIDRLLARHPVREQRGGQCAHMPVVAVQTPTKPLARMLYKTILDKVHAPYSDSAKEEVLRRQVTKILGQVGTRLLVMDEFHDILSGPVSKQREFLVAIKHLSNDLQISLVAAGTRKAFDALQKDEQLANRFDPLLLPRWEVGDEYRRLLASFEKLLPLRRASGLADPRLALHILTMAEGTIGATAEVLRRAAKAAITTGAERITKKGLSDLGWVPRSKRKFTPGA